MIRPLDRLDGIAAPLPLANVDTDQIIPARFLKTISRTGLGTALFDALRRDAAGDPKPDFILNRSPWDRAVFLIARDNFGCGSSREHAPWALLDFGIRCVVAPSFGDIFATNCVKNGILPLSLSSEACERLLRITGDPDRARLQLDIEAETLVVDGEAIPIAVPEAIRRRLIEGRDEIDDALGHLADFTSWDDRAAFPRPVIDIAVLDRLAGNNRSAAETD